MIPMSPRLDGVPIAVVTVSDRAFTGARADGTGPLIAEAFRALGADVSAVTVPDEIAQISIALDQALASGRRAVVTTGGTGIGLRDVTPEATAPFIARELPGIPELLRAKDAPATPLVALSRGRAGVTANHPPALVINLPGSVRAVSSALEVLPAIVAHALAQLDGGDH